MIVLRNKKFSVPKPGEMISPTRQQQVPQQGNDNSQELTSKDLQLEQMRMQKQILQIQHQKEQMKIKEDMARRRNLTQLNKMESEEKQTQQKNQIKTRKIEANNDKVDNTGLYKTKSKPVQPVPMKV